jgi:hypothetical protein
MQVIAWISLSVAFLCAVIIAADEVRRPQKMMVMNIVWPVTALYLSVFALWAYFTIGVTKSKRAMRMNGGSGMRDDSESPPTLAQAAVAATHCGAGCVLADVAVEFVVAGLGLTILGLSLWASFVYDFIGAWMLGIAFQYFSIQPMRHLPPGQALIVAMKADTLSILAFQAGMYAFMALNFFVLAPRPRPEAFEARYWLMMQIAMIIGYATSLPMNWWLLRRGLKEKM